MLQSCQPKVATFYAALCLTFTRPLIRLQGKVVRGGTDDNAIARLHAVQGGAFAVVGLNVAYDKAARGVIGAGGDDPVFWVWLGWVLHGRAPVVSWRFTGGGTDRSRQEVYDRRCALNAQVRGGQDAHSLRTVR